MSGVKWISVIAALYLFGINCFNDIQLKLFSSRKYPGLSISLIFDNLKYKVKVRGLMEGSYDDEINLNHLSVIRSCYTQTGLIQIPAQQTKYTSFTLFWLLWIKILGIFFISKLLCCNEFINHHKIGLK